MLLQEVNRNKDTPGESEEQQNVEKGHYESEGSFTEEEERKLISLEQHPGELTVISFITQF